MNVLFDVRLSNEMQGVYKRNLPPEFHLYFRYELDEPTLEEILPDLNILVAYKINRETLEKAKKLSHIQVPWTGVESLDFNLLKEFPNITVSNSHSNSLAIAEHAVALFLAAAKRIVYSDRKMRIGDWGSRYDESDGVWINQKILGVIGYGSIGKRVARIMKRGFNCTIYAIKRSLEENSDPEELCDFLGTINDLSKLLRESDLILVSLPLTNETRGLLGEKELKLIKKTGILVNISRGPIIDEKALFMLLKQKSFVAGIDTWYNYPHSRDRITGIFQNFAFQDLDNILMTPHAAFKVSEREIIFSEDIIKNLLRIHQGLEPLNQLDLDLGY
ncbi:2-hydroxyacid dehydrogenase [Candidatus Hodarchaeum mangrovi]